MAETSIEWTDAVWNPVRGCSIVSPGCHSCYAMRQAARFDYPGGTYEGLTKPGPSGPQWSGKINLVEDKLSEPLHWKKPRRVFVNSMSDLFHKDVPDEFIDRVFAVMALADHCTFQILTKRAERMAAYFAAKGLQDRVYEAMEREAEAADIADFLFDAWPLPNVWLGVSVENQKAADQRIPLLLQTPAAVRFLSCEPLLDRLELPWLWKNEHCPIHDRPRRIDDQLCPKAGIDWVIVGGESGPGARPCDVAWIRSIVQQCKAAGISCFVKQLGARPYIDHSPEPAASIARKYGVGPLVAECFELTDKKGGDMAEFPADLRVREFPV